MDALTQIHPLPFKEETGFSTGKTNTWYNDFTNSWSYRRLIWYTPKELVTKARKLMKQLDHTRSAKLIRKIKLELRTIQKILS